MAVAHDAVTESATFTTTSPHTFSHTPVGTPRGVAVEIDHGEVVDDLINGAVTYGGVAMERVTIGADTSGELGRVYIYFLGANIPTGTQTVSIAHTATATVKHAAVATVTAGTDTEIASGMGNANQVADPRIIIGGGTNSDGTANEALAYVAIYSGHDDLASLAVLGTMTAMVDHDFGTFVSRFDRLTTATTGPITIGYTAVLEDLAIAGIAIREVDTGGAYVKGGIAQFLTTTTTSTVTRQGGQLLDHDLYCFAISRDHTSGTALATCTDDSGGAAWALVSNDPDRKLNVWWKRGVATSGLHTVTVAGAVGSLVVGIVYCKNTGDGSDPTTNLTVETNASADETHASITPTNVGSIVLFGVGDYGDDANAVTVLAGATMGTLEPEIFEQLSTGGNDCRLTVTGRPLVSGGTGNLTWTQTDSTTKSVVFAVAPGTVTPVTVTSVPTDTIADTPTSLVEAAQAFTVLPPVAGIDVDVVVPEVTTHQFFGVDAAIASTLPAAVQTSETGLTVQAWMG